MNPKNPKTAHFVVSQGFGGHVATTRDGGKSWSRSHNMLADHVYNPTLPASGDRANISGPENISISPADPERVHLAGNWNPAMSRDGGKTWVESARGADITCFHDIRHLDGVTYGAAMDEGSFATRDGGTTWKAGRFERPPLARPAAETARRPHARRVHRFAVGARPRLPGEGRGFG